MTSADHSLETTAHLVETRQAAFIDAWPTWTPRTIADHVTFCASRWPGAPQFVSEGRKWTYAEVDAYVHRAAAAFHASGVRRGSRVGLLMGNCAEFFALKFALTRLGALAVPLNYLLAPVELAYVLSNSGVSTIVFDLEISNRDMRALLDDAGGIDRSTTMVARQPHPSGGVMGLQEFLVRGDGVSAPSAGQPSDGAEIMYTAGSSGVPKGVVLHNDALLRESYGTALTRALPDGISSLTALPPFHLFGYAQAVLPPSFVGGCVTLQTRFDAARQLDMIVEESIEDVVGVAAMFYRTLALLEGADAPTLPSLRSVFIGGDAVPEGEWKRIREHFGVDEVTTGFGMTEVQGTSFMVPPGSPDEVLANTIGWESNAGCAGLQERGGAQHRWRLVDPSTNSAPPRGAVGELHYQGPSIATGYWGMSPDEDDRRADGWFKSGDLARVRDDGAVVFTGRISETYRSGGELVTPREVEAVIASLADVAAVYVIGVRDRQWGQVGYAWVVPEGPPGTLTENEILDHCRRHLARYKVPKQVSFLAGDEVPTSASGKVLRRGLIAMAEARADTDCDPAGTRIN